jgi:glycerol-3-phosphate acyltransferase PlsY
MHFNWLMALGLLIAYLIGSFSSAVWIGRWFYHTDVRKQGSGNAGATNTLRVLGVKAGIVVMLLDVVKGWGAVALAEVFAVHSPELEELINFKILLGAFVVLGHVFPVFTGFKGGKGVATLVGVVLALYNPLILLIVVVWFVLVFLFTKYVSLASITSAILFALLSILVFKEQNIYLVVLAIIIAVFIPLTHYKNISRLLKGKESKLQFRKH